MVLALISLNSAILTIPISGDPPFLLGYGEAKR
jgi:hypothetical protein